MKECRDCRTLVSEQALTCPKCGAPYPARDKWDGWGFEYKSVTRLAGLPLLHISSKYMPDRGPVPAKGIIAIRQFAVGIVSICQFGVGFVGVSQLTIAGFALAQFAVAYSLFAQLGLYVDKGYGPLVRNLLDLLR
jgi:hypothetical protein